MTASSLTGEQMPAPYCSRPSRRQNAASAMLSTPVVSYPSVEKSVPNNSLQALMMSSLLEFPLPVALFLIVPIEKPVQGIPPSSAQVQTVVLKAPINSAAGDTLARTAATGSPTIPAG